MRCNAQTQIQTEHLEHAVAGLKLWDFHSSLLCHIINRSFSDWPLNHAVRGEMLNHALARATEDLRPYSTPSTTEKTRLELERALMFCANSQNNKRDVLYFLTRWMDILKSGMERGGL